jgi:CyaY protein
MDERRYMDLADAALKRVIAAFDDVDLDDADVDGAGDVVTITLRPGQAAKKVVLNTQRPARQLWLAGGGRAWHFDYDELGARWLDDKGTGAELFATIDELCRGAGVKVKLS